MSKGLEALKEIKNRWAWHNPQHDLEDNFDYIEKELKAFQIAIKYRLDLEEVYHKDYEWFMLDHKEDDIGFIPSKEEYELVKEIVDNE